MFSIYNELLLILPPSHFLLKTAVGKLFSVTLAKYNQSEVLVRSGQILHHQYDIFAIVPQTPIPHKTTVVSHAANSRLFLSYEKNKDFNLLFCCVLYFLGHVAGEHEWSDGQCSHSPLVSSDTDKPLLGKGSKAIEVLTKVILDKRWLESLVFYVWFK